MKEKNNISRDLLQFIKIVNELISSENNEPVFKDPEELLKAVDISLNDSPTDDTEFYQILREVIKETPKTSSKRFFNQLFGGRHSKSVIGDLLAVLLNNSMATYKISGIQTLIEKQILEEVRKKIKYPSGYGGTFPTGGSMSNFMTLVAARDKISNHRLDGESKKRLILYCSETAHYSIKKNVSFSGIGINNIRSISVDNNGEMNCKELEKSIQIDLKNNLCPFYVNTTAGATVLGSFDNFDEISKICKKYNLWFHIDGAFGGSLIFSKQHKELLRGIEKSDSFCFNAHKTLGAPLSCSVLLFKNDQDLLRSFDTDANYLFQTHNDKYNLGKTSLECGRRNNALKFWTLWKSVGSIGIQNIVEKQLLISNKIKEYLSQKSEYKLIGPRYSLPICFTYKNIDSIDLCNQLYFSNKLMVSYGSHAHKTFVRLVNVNSQNDIDEVKGFFKIMEDFVEENYERLKKISN